MQKFEYKTTYIENYTTWMVSFQTVNDDLNSHGDKGWRLHSLHGHPEELNRIAVWERAIPSSESAGLGA